MAARLSKSERLRAERRGFRKFIEAERERLKDGDYPEDLAEHIERKTTEYEKKIAQIDEQIGERADDKVLDDERHETETEDVYASNEEAQAEGFDSAHEGNQYWKHFWSELKEYANRIPRAEAQVVEDLASQGITKQDIYEVVGEYEELQEELWGMFGVK